MIKQREDALPSGFGCGSEPAEIADALQTFGQNMLEESAEELSGGEPQCAPLLISTVFILKADVAIVCVEDALRAQRCVMDVCR